MHYHRRLVPVGATLRSARIQPPRQHTSEAAHAPHLSWTSTVRPAGDAWTIRSEEERSLFSDDSCPCGASNTQGQATRLHANLLRLSRLQSLMLRVAPADLLLKRILVHIGTRQANASPRYLQSRKFLSQVCDLLANMSCHLNQRMLPDRSFPTCFICFSRSFNLVIYKSHKIRAWIGMQHEARYRFILTLCFLCVMRVRLSFLHGMLEDCETRIVNVSTCRNSNHIFVFAHAVTSFFDPAHPALRPFAPSSSLPPRCPHLHEKKRSLQC
eukprot:747289-Hanusia_phi.AAC.3